jgi:hypothetical protein
MNADRETEHSEAGDDEVSDLYKTRSAGGELAQWVPPQIEPVAKQHLGRWPVRRKQAQQPRRLSTRSG